MIALQRTENAMKMATKMMPHQQLYQQQQRLKNQPQLKTAMIALKALPTMVDATSLMMVRFKTPFQLTATIVKTRPRSSVRIE